VFFNGFFVCAKQTKTKIYKYAKLVLFAD